MRKTLRSSIVWGLLALILGGANVQLATAHKWQGFRWYDRTIYVYNTAIFQAEAEAALNDWDVNTALSLPEENFPHRHQRL